MIAYRPTGADLLSLEAFERQCQLLDCDLGRGGVDRAVDVLDR